MSSSNNSDLDVFKLKLDQNSGIIESNRQELKSISEILEGYPTRISALELSDTTQNQRINDLRETMIQYDVYFSIIIWISVLMFTMILGQIVASVATWVKKLNEEKL